VASLIANHGIKETEKWAKGFVANFSRKPQGNDRAQIIAVANGEAEIAIANSYYFGLMLSGKKRIRAKKICSKSFHALSKSDRKRHTYKYKRSRYFKKCPK
jgi:iron(III) transport system substrate-binding protein